MISIIICSVNPELLRTVKISIAATIGCDFEIIDIDNRSNRYSIFSAYNEGAHRAKYSILCFAHEDIEFYSSNWGLTIAKIFANDNTIGLIGACGGIIKTEIPTSWVDIPSKYYVSGLIDEIPEDVIKSSAVYKEVAVIDGLFMATTKETWQHNPFPNLNGFHGYDLEYSLRIGILKKIVVLKNLNVLHKSKGSFNEEWFNTTLQIHSQYKRHLPRYTKKQDTILKEIYKLNSLRFIKYIYSSPLTKLKKISLVTKYIITNNNVLVKDKLRSIYYWARLLNNSS